MAKKTTKGKRKPGPGRKKVAPELKGVTICGKVPRALAEQFTAKAKAMGLNKSAAITEAIRQFVG